MRAQKNGIIKKPYQVHPKTKKQPPINNKRIKDASTTNRSIKEIPKIIGGFSIKG